MDLSHRQSTSSKRATKGGGGTPAPSSEAALGNSELAELLLAEAARQEGVADQDLLFGEDPGKYWFAEDGEDQQQTNGTRRQQADGLPALRPKHEGSAWEDFTQGTAFVKGANDAHAVDANDVKQGGLGDCYLIAGMAAVARADPKLIENLIKDNGDGTFDVSLYIRPSRYGSPRKVTKTVDSRLAVKYSGKPLYAGVGDQEGGKSELWTALIEKTVAQHKESYDLISGGNINNHGFTFAGTTELLTGKMENYINIDSIDKDDALLYIEIALEEGRPVTVDSRNLESDAELTQKANAKNVYWNHAYAPVSVDLSGGSLDLQNPWGSDHVDDLKVEDFMKYYRSIRIGGGRL